MPTIFPKNSPSKPNIVCMATVIITAFGVIFANFIMINCLASDTLLASTKTWAAHYFFSRKNNNLNPQFALLHYKCSSIFTRLPWQPAWDNRETPGLCYYWCSDCMSRNCVPLLAKIQFCDNHSWTRNTPLPYFIYLRKFTLQCNTTLFTKSFQC